MKKNICPKYGKYKFPVNKLKTYTEKQLADKQEHHSEFLIIKEINHKAMIMYSLDLFNSYMRLSSIILC